MPVQVLNQSIRDDIYRLVLKLVRREVTADSCTSVQRAAINAIRPLPASPALVLCGCSAGKGLAEACVRAVMRRPGVPFDIRPEGDSLSPAGRREWA